MRVWRPDEVAATVLNEETGHLKVVVGEVMKEQLHVCACVRVCVCEREREREKEREGGRERTNISTRYSIVKIHVLLTVIHFIVSALEHSPNLVSSARQENTNIYI